MKKVTACPRLMQTIFREATPAPGSAGCWPKAVACSRGDGCASTPGIRRGHLPGTRVWWELISSQQHTAWFGLQAPLQGQGVPAELRQVSNRSDQSWYFCAATGFSPYFALRAEPHWDGKEQPSLQTVLACEHIAFLQRDPTKQLPQLLPLCSIQYLPYFFTLKI